MKKSTLQKTASMEHWFRLLLVVVAVLAVWAVISIQPGYADSGGWPTATATLPPLPTVPPTWTPLAILPAPTETITVFIVPTEAVIAQVATPPPAKRSVNFVCWPFAIAFILVVILAGIIFLQRRGENSY